MGTGPRLKVSSDRLVKPGIEPATPGLQGKRFIHYTTAAPIKKKKKKKKKKRVLLYSTLTLTLCLLGYLACFLSSADFCQKTSFFFKTNHSGIPSECQTV